MNFNCASDLHRKGELNKINEMNTLALQIESASKGGLGAAWITEGYFGCDGVALIPNSPDFTNQSGWVLFNEDTQQAFFMADEDEE